MTIWKFAIRTINEQQVNMPEGAQILCVQMQNGIPCIWAYVNPTKPLKEKTIRTYDTGETIEVDVQYIGTYQMDMLNGNLVFHVFLDLEEYKPSRIPENR